MHSRNRDADVENAHVDTAGKGEGGTNWEIRVDIHVIYTTTCKIASEWEAAV